MCKTFHEIEIPIGLIHGKKGSAQHPVSLCLDGQKEKGNSKKYSENIKVFCIMYTHTHRKHSVLFFLVLSKSKTNYSKLHFMNRLTHNTHIHEQDK